MKAYLFNTENGLYEGVTYEEAGMLKYEEGITTIPPPEYEHGQVPVFDRRNKLWGMIPAAVAEQLLSFNDEADTESKS